ncbi:hypothetical protein BHE74_00004641 [Ensete ventricosum]|nr:hypothetical protein BHE74_00004641 [Ensete ventricosum]
MNPWIFQHDDSEAGLVGLGGFPDTTPDDIEHRASIRKTQSQGLGRMHLMGIPPSQYLLYRMQATPPHGNVGWGEPHRAIARGLSLIPLDSCVSCFGAMTVGSMEKTIVGKKAHAYC